MKDHIVIRCSKCGTQNRIHSLPSGAQPICGRCKNSLTQSMGVAQKKQRQKRRLNIFLSAFFCVLICGAGFGIGLMPKGLKKDFSELEQKEALKTSELNKANSEKLIVREKALEQRVASIDAEALRKSAAAQYYEELFGRASFEKRFALSPREKAQLHMQALASDSTKSFHDAIRSVAEEASPRGAEINIHESSNGIALEINFDMSSMTEGELGTRTKHHSIESLRKEVVSLISRVTNDIFTFCKNLNISSIHVGCRHHVRITYSPGSTRDENTLLYKTFIRKSQVRKMTSNPFLDAYSTSEYLEVEEDNFDDITIVTTQL